MEINSLVVSVLWSEELSFRADHRYIMSGQSFPSLTILHALWFIIISSAFSIFLKHYFQVSLNLNVILSMVKVTKNNPKVPLQALEKRLNIYELWRLFMERRHSGSSWPYDMAKKSV